MGEIVEPEWTREDHDARTDRLRPLADHLRIGHDVPDDERRYRDTWLHIALLADEWFTDHPPTVPDPTVEARIAGVLREHARWEHGTGPDGYPTHRCRCGVDLPHGRADRVAPLHRAHVAAVLALLEDGAQ